MASLPIIEVAIISCGLSVSKTRRKREEKEDQRLISHPRVSTLLSSLDPTQFPILSIKSAEYIAKEILLASFLIVCESLTH
jgi:hypothetical protein